MQQGNFIDVFLARHVSGTYAHHQEHYMLSCSIWFSVPSFWMGGEIESRWVGRVYGAYGAVVSHGTIRTVHTLKITTHPKTRVCKHSFLSSPEVQGFRTRGNHHTKHPQPTQTLDHRHTQPPTS